MCPSSQRGGLQGLRWNRVSIDESVSALERCAQFRFCLFISHQWLGWTCADPTGEQLETLRATLQKLFRGALKVKSGSWVLGGST